MLVEAARAAPRDALSTHGWLSQEVLVADVDRLAAQLAASPFEVLRPSGKPRYVGPDSCLPGARTRRRNPLPDSGQRRRAALRVTDLSGPVDHLFIPVLSSPDRDAALAAYERCS